MKSCDVTSTRNRHALSIALCLFACLWLAACAGGVRGGAPFAQVTNWRIEGRELVLEIVLSNLQLADGKAEEIIEATLRASVLGKS